MGLFEKLNSKWTFKCGVCDEAIKPGEFMSIVGKSPEKSYGGMLEPLINKFVEDSDGKIYCGECFNKKFNNT
jgi:hypothetical protein